MVTVAKYTSPMDPMAISLQFVKGDSRDPQGHIFRDSYGSGMGIVWEAYHKGVPLLGGPCKSH